MYGDEYAILRRLEQAYGPNILRRLNVAQSQSPQTVQPPQAVTSQDFHGSEHPWAPKDRPKRG